jgi:hypothetical protein
MVTSKGWALTWVSNRDEAPPGRRTSSLKDTSVDVRTHVEINEKEQGVCTLAFCEVGLEDAGSEVEVRH